MALIGQAAPRSTGGGAAPRKGPVLWRLWLVGLPEAERTVVDARVTLAISRPVQWTTESWRVYN